MKKAYLLDMDGVIYRENQLIPGAKDLIDHFIESSTPFMFLTNNSVPTPEDLVIKLRHLGINNLTPRHFYTSALNTADFLAEVHPNCTAFVIGESGISSALKDVGIANDSISPTYVVVGEGMTSLERLNKAHELVEKGARIVATNPDNWCPVAKSMTRPGAGATVSYLEASTGKRAYYLGKPNAYMFTRASKLLHSRFCCKDAEVIMVGDTMETDIRGAVEIGMQSYLVLTGSTALHQLSHYVYQPTRVLESVADILKELLTGQASDRKESPAFLVSKVDEAKYAHKNGDRHQTDHVIFEKPKPQLLPS